MVEQAKSAAVKSWKTTAAGALAGVAIMAHQLAALLDSDPATIFSIEGFLTGLGLLGVGLFARDNGVSSEQAGAK